MLLARITIAAALAALSSAQALAQSGQTLSGTAAFGDWRADAPGTRRLIRAQDLPQPYATPSSANQARVVARPRDAEPKVPAGFAIKPFVTGLDGPRLIRTAPNGDIFVAESGAGRIRVLRPSSDGAAVEQNEVFATSLERPFGIAFYPVTGEPQWVYVANTNSVVRFPYRSGDLKARGKPETIVAHLPAGGGHWTRDVVFSKDGPRMFVSVGSGSNVAEGLSNLEGAALDKWQADQPLGAIWGAERERADVLQFTPDGQDRLIYATGIRNCVGMAVDSAGTLWCSTNERDGLGNNLPPDYITRVKQGAYYGWPWYYIGDHQDPRHKGARADLAGKVTVPDVLIQPHSASLQMTFYDGKQFPAEYRGSIFAALHGSWNRGQRTGYKVIRALVKDGVPTGAYEDFVTGFVTGDGDVWARPVGVTVAKDGSLLVSEDGNGTIWRVNHTERATER